MGIRFASLRHSDVVMAPALTEATQSQNFKLPASHSSPLSPIGVPTNVNKLLSSSQLLSDVEIHKVDNFKGCPNQNEKSYNRVTSSSNYMKCPVDVKSLAYDNLKTLAIASEFLKNTLETSKNTRYDSGRENGAKSCHIMNYSDPSMGDKIENMCLHRSDTEAPAAMGSRIRRIYSRVNNTDHQMKEYKGNLTQSSRRTEPGTTNMLDKQFEIPLTVNFTEPERTELESNATFQKPSFVDDSFESEFLSSVDVMEICVEDNFDAKLFGLDNKGYVSNDSPEESLKNIQASRQKVDFLSRRIKMFQSKLMLPNADNHVKKSISYYHDNTKQNNSSSVSGSGECSSVAFGRESDSVSVQGRDERLCSFPSSSSVLKAPDNPTQATSSPSKSGYKKCSVNSGEQSFPADDSKPDLKPGLQEVLQDVSGQLRAQLKFVQEEFDSEATASSSGGESCDEFLLTEENQSVLPIEKRAAWRWAQQRARIASRWTWLQAQISDLEYRIRQNNDVHRQIRSSKEPVVLGEVGSPPVVVNGYHGTDQWCARVRPLERRLLAKRKLLRVQGLHSANKRAARPASVRCTCRPPTTACALCTGRPDPTRPRAPAHHLPTAERVAAADPAFHPVLSMPHEVKESIHYDGIMKTNEWQQKTLRSSLKSMRAAGLPKFDRDTVADRKGKKLAVEPRRKYTSRLKKNTANNLATKTTRKQTKGRKPKNTENDTPTVARARRRRNGQKSAAYSCCDEGDGHDAAAAVSKQSSPVASPGPSSSSLERLAGQAPSRLTSGEASRRKRENSYDIDNVVIPSSLSSAARLEKIQYKEIPTPKWRIVENDFIGRPKLDLRNNGAIRRSSHENEEEDISDETVALRHERCEMEEKKKFMSYIKLPYSGRSRANRRTDSRAESSGANSPDPMSPNPEYQEGVSPVMSPLPAVSDLDQCTRRRTVSSSRWHRDDLKIGTLDIAVESTPPIAPYEPRKFPLSDDVYERMLRSMPSGHPYPPPIDEPKKFFTKENDFDESRPVSPSTDSTESAIGEEDPDPNDPEWTVEDERDYERDRVKSSVKR